MLELKAWLEGFKLPPRHLAAVVLVSGSVLALPAQVLDRLGIAQLAHDYRAWIGSAFLVAASLLAVSLSTFLYAARQRRGARNDAIARRAQRFKILTEQEKQILRLYISQQTRTQVFRPENGVVCGLEAAGIIQRVSNTGNIIYGFPYNLAEFAWEHLNENRGLLD